MACLVRIGFHRFVNNTTPNVAAVTCIGVRNISGKTMRVQEPAPRPAPWPYQTKGYNMLTSFYDRTTKRFNENSKLIVVEGPVAAGKSKFAQELADELEMAYFPEANLDMIYTNPYGYDLKQLDPQLPESCRSFDVNNFLVNPKHHLAAKFQLHQYAVKYSQYIDALAHILNTGQGVVLDRCVFSDFVFVEAMCSKGYISKKVRSLYYDIRHNSINELLRPHLVIYLDVPVDKIIENVKKRKISYEVDSPVLTTDYLSVMEKFYKQHYLKQINTTSELLVYDWSEGGEVEVIVEDIERIKFERTDPQDLKFQDWRSTHEEDFAQMRILYTNKKTFLMSYLNVPNFESPELLIEADDWKLAQEIKESAPGMEYEYGYNTNMGDSSYLFKTNYIYRDTLPLTERRVR